MKNILMPLPVPEEMRTWDQACGREFGLPEFTLMENAGRAAWEVLRARPEYGESKLAVVMAGSGNNAGDGFVLARYIHDNGGRALVLLSRAVSRLSGAARAHALLARRCGVPMRTSGGGLKIPGDLRPDILVDALCGTGLNGDLRPERLGLVRWMNGLGERTFTLALDIPSGLCALSGRPRPEAVRADVTVSFEAAKPGLILPEARPWVGELEVRPIGVPALAKVKYPASHALLAPKPGVLPKPSGLEHKGDRGRVLIAGASPGLCGAAHLAGLAALRAGAGLVTIACPAGLATQVKSARPELMTLPLGDPKDLNWSAGHIPALLERIRALGSKSALLIGPGLGRARAAQDMLRAVLSLEERPPLILDADALSCGPPLELLKESDIITPHPGEMLRLLQSKELPEDTRAKWTSVDLLQASRFTVAREFSRHCRAVLVLKGPGTLIAQNGSPLIIAPFGLTNLAVGGSGDVLAGLCAALSARSHPALEAAGLAVHIHGRAGEALHGQYPAGGNLAGEIAEIIPEIMGKLTEL